MRLMSLLAFLALLAGCALVSAEVKITGETKYKGCALVSLRAEGVDPKSAILWDVYPLDGVQMANNPRGVFEFVGKPGKYSVSLLVISNTPEGGLKVDRRRVTVEVCECTPPPPIDPPDPPDPPPSKGKLDPVGALGRITFGNSGCTATVCGPRRPDGRWDVLTAAHCVSGKGQRGVMRLKDGRSLKLMVVGHFRGSDISWCVTDETYDDLAYASIAAGNPAPGTPIWHMGYGVDKPGNREDGVITAGEDAQGQIRMELNVSSGDSGGGIFRTDTGELISTVCCTKAPGRRIDVWGGSTTNILKTRALAADDWVPVPMPGQRDRTGEAPMDGWVPVPIPERAAPKPAEAEPEPKPHVKTCPCSRGCTCGCNAGRECRCGNTGAALAPGPLLFHPHRLMPMGFASRGCST